MDSGGNGLMAFWADIDIDYMLRYQEWHNCEHMPERLSIPGFLEGRRYRALDNSPHFLMFYETRTADTCASDGYMAALNAPTPWTREALTHFRKPNRTVYSKIGAAEGRSRSQGSSRGIHLTAPYLTSIRFDLSEGTSSEGEYAGKWLQAAAGAENVRRVRFYRKDDAVANIATSERKIYSGGPGKQAYLLMIEHSLPPPPSSETSHAGDAIRIGDVALGQGAATKRLNEESGVYWMEMAYPAKLLAKL